MTFTVTPHPRCLRGLHTLYRTEADWGVTELADALEAACPGCVRADESWGPRPVPRIIVPFQVEYRVGERDREVSLIHRTTATPEQRQRSVQRLERLLSAL